MSAWRIEIRTGFYHRAKKTRPIKGLKLNPAVWRWWVLLAQCETLGEYERLAYRDTHGVLPPC